MFTVNIHPCIATVTAREIGPGTHTVSIKPAEERYTEITIFTETPESARELTSALRKIFTEPAIHPSIEPAPADDEEELPF